MCVCSPCWTGGDDGVGYLNDLYILDLTTFVWARGFSTGTTPCARSRHTMVAIDAEHLVVFGGGDDTRVYNDLYLFDTTKMFWSRIAPTYGVSVAGGAAAGASLAVSAGGFSHSAHVPAPRWGHAAVVVAPGKFVVFGGHDGSSMLNDVWLFDAMLCCWTQVHPRNAARAAPSPRAGHVMSAVPSSSSSSSSTIVIFGGGDSEQVLNDIYLLVPVEPEQQDAQAQQAQAQGSSASAVVAMIRSSQITYRWVRGPSNRDANPLPRCAHSVCPVPMRAVAHAFTPFESAAPAVAAATALVIFAGGDSTRRLKDIFFLDVPHLLHIVRTQQTQESAAKAAAAPGAAAAGGGTATAAGAAAAAAAGSGAGTAQGTGGAAAGAGGAAGAAATGSGSDGAGGADGATEEQLSKAAAALVGTAPAPAGVTAMNAFLKSVGFEAYAPVFAREEVTIETLPLLSERHLEALGVASLGVRLRMLAAIRKRYGHTSSLQQSRSQSSSSSSSSSSSAAAAAAPAEREDIAALTAATRQLQKSTDALTKAVTLIATMLQEQRLQRPPGTGEEAVGEADEPEACSSEGAEGTDAAHPGAGEGEDKDAAAAPPAGAATAEPLPEQEHSPQEHPPQQQQQQKKKSRRNKSKSRGVSLAAHTGAGAHTGAAGEALVHVNDSRLVLQQPMPNPFVRNATQPYAPLLHPPKDSAADGC